MLLGIDFRELTMKRIILSLALLASPLVALASVDVSVNLGAPNYYGEVPLANMPPPQVLYSQPIVIQRGRGAYSPIYLRVPPYQARHWGRYCSMYNACYRPVYFVNDNWYRDAYGPGRHRGWREHDHRNGHDRRW